MLVLYGLILSPPVPGSFYGHRPLLVADTIKLQELFPDSEILARFKKDNAVKLTSEEARELYDMLKSYRDTHEISSESYVASGMMPSFRSSLSSVFDDLLPFLERELGVQTS